MKRKIPCAELHWGSDRDAGLRHRFITQEWGSVAWRRTPQPLSNEAVLPRRNDVDFMGQIILSPFKHPIRDNMEEIVRGYLPLNLPLNGA
jgi:hypothetical protein